MEKLNKSTSNAIAVDFDGVIHKYSQGWKDGSIYDPPVEGAKECLSLLVKKGFTVVIFTTRLNPELNDDVNLEVNKVTRWLSSFGFRKGVHYHEITAIKPRAVVYIDDRAMRFINWQDAMKRLL